MTNIGRLLERLGLGQYEAAFVRNDVDFEALRHLTDADLKELGLSLGHRRKLLAALAADAAPAADAAVPAAAPGEAARPGAQRRQLTVLFCDLVGSTELTATLGPERMGEILRVYQDACTAAIGRFDGFPARFIGDGVLAYFGFPRAYEDAAERGVRAGLSIVDAVRRIEVPAGPPLHVRIGIATGLVVIGDNVTIGGVRELAVTGEILNLASRLQQLADPDCVIIAAATRRLLGSLFEVEEVGPQLLKGIAGPVPAWRVVRERRAASRFEAVHAIDISPLVGREQEVALLLDRWRSAKQGEGQTVLLGGEAGIGKSRIGQTLRERIAGEPHICVRYQCSPFHANSALHPTISQLEFAARIAPGDQASVKLDKLERLLTPVASDPAAAVSLIAALLSIPTDGRYPELGLTPQKQKQRTLDALLNQLFNLARRQPVLLLVEDAHWMDPTTLELVTSCIERTETASVLIVITFRPEFHHPWSGLATTTSLALNRLGRHPTLAIIEDIAGKPMPAEVAEQIIAKTDGVPLFVQELTKTVIESGLVRDAGNRYELAGPLPTLAIPATLQDSLMARLDRLSPVKEVAQIAAAIGREFSYELLDALTPQTGQPLHDALARLLEADLIHQRTAPPNATYVFKHALVRDVAYSTLLLSRHQQLHSEIARALLKQAPETVDTQPELLAHHYTEAGLAELAVDHWLKAGQRAAARSAYAEAIGQLTEGLRVLGSIPGERERAPRELLLQIALANALIAARGYATAETGAAWKRANELAEALQDHERQLESLYGLWAYHCVAGEHPVALEIAKQFLSFADEHGSRDAALVGNRVLGVSCHSMGDQARGRHEIETALALYDPELHRSLAFSFSVDQRAAGLAFLSLILWLQGFPDQATRVARASVEEARAAAHTNSIGYAYAYGACPVAELCGDLATLETLANTLLAFAEEHALDLWRTFGLAYRGSALVSRGAAHAGIALQEKALAGFQSIRSALRLPAQLKAHASALSQAGRHDEAMRVIDGAIEQAELSEERWCWPELLRVKGDVLLLGRGASAADEAERLFEEALADSRRQQAASWELRAATSLTRLRRSQGLRGDASRLLAEVYARFTEGFATADLVAAKALLAEAETQV